MKHPSKVYSGLVYLAPSGDWAWRIFCDSEDVVRGAGYAGAQEAEADCREFLNDYDGQAEIVVEKPGFRFGALEGPVLRAFLHSLSRLEPGEAF